MLNSWLINSHGHAISYLSIIDTFVFKEPVPISHPSKLPSKVINLKNSLSERYLYENMLLNSLGLLKFLGSILSSDQCVFSVQDCSGHS